MPYCVGNCVPAIVIGSEEIPQHKKFCALFKYAVEQSLLQIEREMIAAVKQMIDIPLIVGGGIRTPEVAAAAVKAGADIIVTGTFVEQTSDESKIRSVIDAVKN